MRKRNFLLIISTLLIVMLGVFSASVYAEETASTKEELQAAIDKSVDSPVTVNLTQSLDLDGGEEAWKDNNTVYTASFFIPEGANITINGGDNTITSKANYIFFAGKGKSNLVINNLNIEATNASGTAIYMYRDAACSVTLNECDFNVTRHGIFYAQATSGTELSDISVNVSKSNIINTSIPDPEKSFKGSTGGIAIKDFGNTCNVTVSDTNIKGFAYSFDVWSYNPDREHATGPVINILKTNCYGFSAINAWTIGATYNIENSYLVGVNPLSGGANDFATIVFNADIYDLFGGTHAVNNTLTIKDSTVTNAVYGTNNEDLIRIDCGVDKLVLSGNVKFIDTSKRNNGVLDLGSMSFDEYKHFVDNNIDTTEATLEFSEGLELLPPADVYYYWLVSGEKQGGIYEFYEPFESSSITLMDGEFLQLLHDITLDHSVSTSADIIFINDGYTITIPNGYNFTVGKDAVIPENMFVAPEGYEIVVTDNGDDTITYYAAQVLVNNTTGTPFYTKEDEEVSNTETGYYWDVEAEADVNSVEATFTSETEGKSLTQAWDLSKLSGDGNVSFSVLLLGAPDDVTATIRSK